MGDLKEYYQGAELPKVGENKIVTAEELCALLHTEDTLLEGLLTDWVYFKRRWYHVKERKRGEEWKIFNELLGEKISEYFHVATIHSILVARKKRETLALLSKPFQKEGYRYFSAFDVEEWRNYPGIGLRNLTSLGEWYSDANRREFCQEMKRLLVRNFYTSRDDFHAGNCPFEKSPRGTIRLAPQFDYEHSFHFHSRFFSSSGGQFFEFDLENPDVLSAVQQDSYFKWWIDKMMRVNLDSLIEEVEDEYHLLFPREYVEQCQREDVRVKTLAQSKKII